MLLFKELDVCLLRLDGQRYAHIHIHDLLSSFWGKKEILRPADFWPGDVTNDPETAQGFLF